MKASIAKGKIELNFAYDSETNMLTPTIGIQIEGAEIPIEVMYRLAAGLTEYVLTEHRKKIYENDCIDDQVKISQYLREYLEESQ